MTLLPLELAHPRFQRHGVPIQGSRLVVKDHARYLANLQLPQWTPKSARMIPVRARDQVQFRKHAVPVLVHQNLDDQMCNIEKDTILLQIHLNQTVLFQTIRASRFLQFEEVKLK